MARLFLLPNIVHSHQTSISVLTKFLIAIDKPLPVLRIAFKDLRVGEHFPTELASYVSSLSTQGTARATLDSD